MKQFLSSIWKHTLILTWEIEPELLIEHLPHKIGLYTQNNKALLSLVVYHYENTKVKGIKMPFHVSFPEIDLRYYGVYNNQLGVGFVQHIVPRYCISLWAKRIFNENYVTLPMDYSIQETETSKVLHYKVWKNKKQYSIDFLTNKELAHHLLPIYNQIEWGFGIDKYGNTITFKLDKIENFQSFTSLDYVINLDFSFLFGRKWAFLNETSPMDVIALSDNKIRISQPTYLLASNQSAISNYIQTPIHNIDKELILDENNTDEI